MKWFTAILAFLLTTTRDQAQVFLENQTNSFPAVGYSAATWGDIDNDGDWDCLVTGSTNSSPSDGGVTKVFRNDGNANFVEVATGIAGITAGSAQWGDFDNDGDLDLLLGGKANSDITRVYRNEGGFVFTNLNLGLPAVSYMQVDWGDYDNDGKRDILISGNQMTKVFHNDGNGSFSDAAFPLSKLNQNMQAWFDYDNDGDLDILLTALAHGSDDFADLYRNDDGRKFTSVATSVRVINGGEVQTADFDGDSDWDIGMVGTCCGGVPGAAFYRNNGGAFTGVSVLPNGFGVGTQAGSLAWGDYDGDGYADLCIAGRNALDQILTTVLHSDRGTNWTLLGDVFRGIINGGVTWTDLDGDGGLDVHVIGYTNFPSSNPAISRSYLNLIAAPTTPSTPTNLASSVNLNNDVVFSWMPDRSGPGSEYYALRVGTSPGGMDVHAPEAILSSGRRLAPNLHGLVATNRWLLKDLPPGTYYWSVQSVNAAFRGAFFAPEATFTITNVRPVISAIPNLQVAPEETTQPIPFAVSDAETPAALLTVTASATDTNLFPVSSFAFAGSGTNRTITITPAPGRQGTATVSVVVWDAVGASRTSSFEVRVEYFTSVTLPTAADSFSVDIADYENNGFLDLALGRSAALIRNPGISPFTNAMTLNSNGTESPAFAWGDYDNDGFMDLLMAGAPSRLFHNERNGKFSTNLLVSLPGLIYPAAAWGDFNNDGRLDFVICGAVPPNGSPSSTRLYRNEGNGTFAEMVVGLPGVANGSVEWADFNGDGRLDLALCGRSTGNNGLTRVYRNNGDGTFTDSAAGLPNISFGQARAGDFNNDGHLDLMVAGSMFSSVATAKLYRNNGDGTFSDSGIRFPDLQMASIRWGDFNNDGWSDLVITGQTNSSSSVTKVFANRGTYFTDVKAPLPRFLLCDARWADFDRDGQLDLFLTAPDGLRTLHRNNTARQNPPPSPPIGLSAAVLPHNNVVLSWPPSIDPTTSNSSGLHYNLRVGRSPGGMELFAPQSDTGTGERRLPHRGNAGATNRWLLANLSPGTYYWSVQAVDPGFAGSLFATEASFTITNTIDPAANHAPTVVGQSLATLEDVPVPVSLLGSDPDGDPLTFIIVPPTNGVLHGLPPQLTYVPKPNSFGLDHFSFRVRDGLTNSETATVVINVSPVFDPHISGIRIVSNVLEISFNGDPGRAFAMESSTNLLDWEELIVLQDTQTNRTTDPKFLVYVGAHLPQNFIRARLIP